MPTTPVALFAVDAALLQALEGAFGPPIDSYLRGWQVWIEPAADDGPELEYRLHPPAGFVVPAGLDHHDLWDAVIEHLDEEALPLGEERRDLASIWVLLEVFPAYGDAATAEQVRAWAEQALGVPALGHGDVDHERLGGSFRRLGRDFDLPGELRAAILAD